MTWALMLWIERPQTKNLKDVNVISLSLEVLNIDYVDLKMQKICPPKCPGLIIWHFFVIRNVVSFLKKKKKNY